MHGLISLNKNLTDPNFWVV